MKVLAAGRTLAAPPRVALGSGPNEQHIPRVLLLVLAGLLVATGCGRRTLVVVSQDGTEAEAEEGDGEGDGDGGDNPGGPGDAGGAEGGDPGPGPGGDAGAGAEGDDDAGGAGPGEVGGPGPGEEEGADDGGEGPAPAPAYCVGVDACREDKAAAGADSVSEVTWCSHVRGILQSQAAACNTCHSGGTPSSGWSAENYATIFGNGSRAAAKSVIEPCCGQSELLVAARGADGFFAHDGKVSPADVKTIEEWITRDGAPKGEGCD